MIAAVLGALWAFAAWVWWLAPVPISLVLAGMFFGYVAVLLVPRDKPFLRPTVHVTPRVPWAEGHDPNDPARVVVLQDEQAVPLSADDDNPLAEVIPFPDRRSAVA